MDIRNWPLDRIIQLPDCCFGSRYVVSCTVSQSGSGTAWDVSELHLPERAMLWRVYAYGARAFAAGDTFRIATGDGLPTSVAEMSGLTPLLPGFGLQGPSPRNITIWSKEVYFDIALRNPIVSKGRKLVLEVVTATAGVFYFTFAIVISNFPSEVPDCLISR